MPRSPVALSVVPHLPVLAIMREMAITNDIHLVARVEKVEGEAAASKHDMLYTRVSTSHFLDCAVVIGLTFDVNVQ